MIIVAALATVCEAAASVAGTVLVSLRGCRSGSRAKIGSILCFSSRLQGFERCRRKGLEPPTRGF